APASAAVNTASTPGITRAAAASMLRISACACGERSTAACAIPSKTISSRYRPLPVAKRWSSRRFGASPMPEWEVVMIVIVVPAKAGTHLAATQKEEHSHRYRGAKIHPLRIFGLDQCDFPRPPPLLDLLFAADCGF